MCQTDENKSMDLKNIAKRGANKWLFLAAACFITFLHFGFVYSFGALYVDLLDTYHKDRATTVVVHSLLSGITLSTSVLSGILITKYGLPMMTAVAAVISPLGLCTSVFATSVQQLYFTIGILTAFGISITYISNIVIIGRVFDGRQQTMSLTLINASVSVGGLTNPYFFNWLVESYGLSGMFLIVGGLFCHGLCLAVPCWMSRRCLQNSPKEQRNNLPKDNEDSKLSMNSCADPVPKNKVVSCFALNCPTKYLKDLLSVQFVCITLTTAVVASALIAYNGSSLDIAQWKGLSKLRGLSLFLSFNGSQLAARLVSGPFIQLKGVNPFLFSMISALCGFVGQLMIYLSANYIVFIVASCLSGFAMGGIISATVILVWKIVPAKQVPVASGTAPTLCGILTAGLGPLFGSIRDSTNSYSGVILFVISFQITGIFLEVIAMVYHRKAKQKTTISNHINADTSYNKRKRDRSLAKFEEA